MKIIADLHLHSPYSKATSKEMNLDGLTKGAKIKGLNLLGTGDFTHPFWLKELKGKLQEFEDGIFVYKDVYFILSTEVSTIFQKYGKKKEIHHLILAPNFEIVDQINEVLAKYGDLKKDGRPILNLKASELVEILISISQKILVIPAHVWTPWKSLFGSKSGFDKIEDCYEDQVKHIYALETGLSSDPAMNWRISDLDKYTLVSNSDSHSPHPWRLGREANVFELNKLNYKEIFEIIKKKDRDKFLFTIEVDPNYGKYHWDGHRKCKVFLHPKEAIKLNNICPVCKKPLTIGVLHRVEELADRPEGFVPKDAIPFKSILPLYEIISYTLKINQLYSKKVIEIQNKLIEYFGNELNVLLEAKKEELEKLVDKKIAENILKVREGRIRFLPGYDGEYGKPLLNDELVIRKTFTSQKALSDFNKL